MMKKGKIEKRRQRDCKLQWWSDESDDKGYVGIRVGVLPSLGTITRPLYPEHQ